MAQSSRASRQIRVARGETGPRAPFCLPNLFANGGSPRPKGLARGIRGDSAADRPSRRIKSPSHLRTGLIRGRARPPCGPACGSVTQPRFSPLGCGTDQRTAAANPLRTTWWTAAGNGGRGVRRGEAVRAHRPDATTGDASRMPGRSPSPRRQRRATCPGETDRCQPGTPCAGSSGEADASFRNPRAACRCRSSGGACCGGRELIRKNPPGVFRPSPEVFPGKGSVRAAASRAPIGASRADLIAAEAVTGETTRVAQRAVRIPNEETRSRAPRSRAMARLRDAVFTFVTRRLVRGGKARSRRRCSRTRARPGGSYRWRRAAYDRGAASALAADAAARSAPCADFG